MALLAFLFRAILFLFVFRLAGLVLRAFFGGFFQGSRPAASPSRGPVNPTAPGQIEELVRDPVCGVHFPRLGAIVGQYQGASAYFCSGACAAKAQNQ